MDNLISNGFHEAREARHAHCDLRGDELTEHLAQHHDIHFLASDLAENPGRAVMVHRESHPPIPWQPHS